MESACFLTLFKDVATEPMSWVSAKVGGSSVAPFVPPARDLGDGFCGLGRFFQANLLANEEGRKGAVEAGPSVAKAIAVPDEAVRLVAVAAALFLCFQFGHELGGDGDHDGGGSRGRR